ncbi:hypothetical protein RB213_004807, partial [Colletotrichum asianum]
MHIPSGPGSENSIPRTGRRLLGGARCTRTSSYDLPC